MQLHSAFSALGDPIRFSIVEQLLAEGEVAAGELHERQPISAPAVSRHLKVLRESGLVRQRVERQRRIYSINPDCFAAIDDWITFHRSFWTQSLDRLERALENHQKEQSDKDGQS